MNDSKTCRCPFCERKEKMKFAYDHKLNEAFVQYCIADVENAMKLQCKAKSKIGVDNKPKIKNVHFNPPMTIVIWSDGTKTIVKAHHELFDPEKGLAMAIAKKFIGDNKYGYIEEINKWVEKYDKPTAPTIPKLNVDSGALSKALKNLNDASRHAAAIARGQVSTWEVSDSLYWDDSTLRCRHCGLIINGKKGLKMPEYCPGCNSYMTNKNKEK